MLLKINIFALALLLCGGAFGNDRYGDYLGNLSPEQIWQTPRGQMSIELFPESYGAFGIEVFYRGELITERQPVEIFVEPLGSLSFLAPYGNFESFHDGRLEVVTGLEIFYQGRSIDLNRASLVPQDFGGQPGLALVDRYGRQILNLTHFHVLSVPAENRLEIKNADVYPTAQFAELLDFPDHRALMLGMAAFDLALNIPDGAETSQEALQCTSPTWPQEGLPADVALIAIGSIQQMGGTSTDPKGRIKVTPSATLKNVGEADIPWVPKFGQISQYTYEPRDQHPFLLWAMYRVHEGRIEMLGNSGAKHAWLTVNTACPCSGGNILWPQCEDVYGTSINDNGSDLGPRGDIVAHQGLFETCNSFFDPNCVGGQTQGSGNGFLNRMLVHPSDLQVAGADYFFDSWYVVQFDVNIWNTMGYHPISPNPVSGGWSFPVSGPNFQQGPPLGEWVAEDTTDPMEAHEVIVVPSLTPDLDYPDNMPQGHVRVLAKVHDLGNGTYRYNYAVMNYDLDRGLADFIVPLGDGVNVSETWMGGPPDVLDSAWPADVQSDRVVFAPPADVILPWFTLYNFELVTDSAPVAGGTVQLMLAGDDMPTMIEASVPVPGEFEQGPIIFQDRFE